MTTPFLRPGRFAWLAVFAGLLVAFADHLAAAERLVVEMGVEALSTRDVARVAEVPVASLYQYFADKEDVLLALAERDMAEMDEQVAADVAALPSLDLPALVRATIGAFVAVYRRRPAFVVIYLRGRTNTALAQYGRVHNARLAASLREVARLEAERDAALAIAAEQKVSATRAYQHRDSSQAANIEFAGKLNEANDRAERNERSEEHTSELQSH